MRVAGLVLAGGRSSRMGKNKALLRLPDGQTFLENALGILAEACEAVWISRAPDQNYGSLPCVADRRVGLGPLGGIAAGLAHIKSLGFDAAQVLACDLPLMRPSLLAPLRDAPPGALLSVWRDGQSGRLEPLAALYFCSALPFLEDALANGRLALKNAVPAWGVAIRDYGPSLAACFCNCNTPEEYRSLAGFCDHGSA